MARLRCETNTPEVETEVLEAAAVAPELEAHADVAADFEHGQWFVSCLDCGAQWSVNDAEPGPFSFERVTEGDGSCEGA